MIPDETIDAASMAIEEGRFSRDSQRDALWSLIDAARAENRRLELDARLDKERSKRRFMVERMAEAAGGGEEHHYRFSIEMIGCIVGDAKSGTTSVATVDLVRFMRRLGALEDLLGDAEDAQAMWERGYDAGFLKAKEMAAGIAAGYWYATTAIEGIKGMGVVK